MSSASRFCRSIVESPQTFHVAQLSRVMLKKENKTGDDAVDLHSVKLSGGYHMEELPSHAILSST